MIPLRIFLAGMLTIVLISASPACAQGKSSLSRQHNTANEPPNNTPPPSDAAKTLAPGQPLQIQIVAPPPIEKEPQSKGFIEIWGATILGVLGIATTIGGLIVAIMNVKRQIASSEVNMKQQLTNEITKIDEQYKTDLKKLEAQTQEQLNLDAEKERRKRDSLSIILAVETARVKVRASKRKAETLNFSPSSSEHIKRLRITIPCSFETSWNELALLNDPKALSDLTLLKQILDQLQRRIDYILGLPERERFTDSISAEYIGEFTKVFEACENAAKNLLIKLKGVSTDILKTVNELEAYEQLDKPDNDISVRHSRSVATSRTP